MAKQATIDPGVLQAALLGYEIQRSRIDAAIAEIRAELGGVPPRRSKVDPAGPVEQATLRKKRFSASARRRMAAAQKKRWAAKKAEIAKKAAPAEQKAPPKRRNATSAVTTAKRPAQVKAAKKPAPKAAVKATSKRKVKKAAAPTPRPEVPTLQPPHMTAEQPAPVVEASSVPNPESVTE